MADKLEIIRKLLAKADGAATPDEARAYAEKAAEMMARHGVDEALIAAKRPAADDPINKKLIRLDRPYPHERGELLWAIGEGMNCCVMWGGTYATVVGHRSDIERTELLFTQLLLFITGPITAPVDTSWCWDPQEARAETRRWRKSWLHGFAAGIYVRMRDAKTAAVAEAEQRSTGAELVLIDRRAHVDRFVADTIGKVGTHKPRVIDRRAAAQGRAAAYDADLGLSERVGTGAKRAIR